MGRRVARLERWWLAVGREAWTTNDNAEMTTQEREKLRVWHLSGWRLCCHFIRSSTTFQVPPICIMHAYIQKKRYPGNRTIYHGFAASYFSKMQTISRSKRTNPLLLLRYAPPRRIVSNNYLNLNFFYGFVFASFGTYPNRQHCPLPPPAQIAF